MSGELAIISQLLNRPTGGTSTVNVEAAADIPALSTIAINHEGKAFPASERVRSRAETGTYWRTTPDSDMVSGFYMSGLAIVQAWHHLGDNRYIRIYGANNAPGAYVAVCQIDPHTGQYTKLSSLYLDPNQPEATGLIPKNMRLVKLASGEYVVTQYCNSGSAEWISIARISFDDVNTLDLSAATVVRKTIAMGTSGPYNPYCHLAYKVDDDHWALITDYNGTHFYIYTFAIAYAPGDPWHDYGSQTGTELTESTPYSLTPDSLRVLTNGIVLFWGYGGYAYQWKHDVVAKTITLMPVYNTRPPTTGGTKLATKEHATYPRIVYDDGVGGLHVFCAVNGQSATVSMVYDPLDGDTWVNYAAGTWDEGKYHDSYLFVGADSITFTQVSPTKWIAVTPTGEIKPLTINNSSYYNCSVDEISFENGHFVVRHLGIIATANQNGQAVAYVPNDEIDIFHISYGELPGNTSRATLDEFLIGVTDLGVTDGTSYIVDAIALAAISAGNTGAVITVGAIDAAGLPAGHHTDDFIVTSTGNALRRKETK